jgi:hypothetical protein
MKFNIDLSSKTWSAGIAPLSKEFDKSKQNFFMFCLDISEYLSINYPDFIYRLNDMHPAVYDNPIQAELDASDNTENESHVICIFKDVQHATNITLNINGAVTYADLHP